MSHNSLQVARRLPVLLLCLAAAAQAQIARPATGAAPSHHLVVPPPVIAQAHAQVSTWPRLGAVAAERRLAGYRVRAADDDDDDDDEDEDDDSDALPGSV